MFYDKIWHSAIWGFSVKKAAFSCQTSRWWRSTQKWMEWGIWRHPYWHYYLAAHRIQQPIWNYRNSEIPKFRIVKLHVFFLIKKSSTQKWMEWGISRHYFRHYYFAAHRIQQPIWNFRHSEIPKFRDSELWIFTFFLMEEHPKMNGMRNLKTSLLSLLLSCCSPDPGTNSEIPNPEFSRVFQSITYLIWCNLLMYFLLNLIHLGFRKYKQLM